MDQNVLLTVVFSLLKVALWAALAYSGHRLYLKTRRETQTETGATNAGPLWALWMLALFLVVMYTTFDIGGHRPQVSINPDNPALREKLDRVDHGNRPAVKPESTVSPSWQELQEKNRRENEAARKEFEKIPPR